MKWKVGDLVQIPSGGPAMTVVALIFDPRRATIEYRLAWFDETNRMQETVLPEDALIPYEKDQ